MHVHEICQLMAEIEDLEGRISSGSLLEGRMLPESQLLDILTRMARRRAQETNVEQAVPEPSPGLSAAVQEALDHEVKPRQLNHLLSFRQAGVIQSAEQLFLYLERAGDIDPLAFGYVRHLLPDVARIMLVDLNALTRPEYPVRSFLEILLKICRLYDPYSGSRADRWMARMSALVQDLAGSPLPLEAAYQLATRELVAMLNAHNNENLKLAESLVAKEHGQALQDDARLQVNRDLQEAMSGRRLPERFVQFLDRVWSKYMYITYLRHGTASTEWSSGIEHVRILAESLDLQGRDQMFRYYGSHVADALDKVREAAFSIHQDEYLVQRFFEQLNSIHMSIMNEEEPEFGQRILLKPLTVNEASSGGFDRQLATLRVGDWYQLKERGLNLRCKLVEKNRKHTYCLFVNFSGIKVAKYAFDQVHQRLQVGTLICIESTPLFDSALKHACLALSNQLPRMRKQTAEVERAREDILQRRRQAQAQEQLRRLEQQQRREEEQRCQERLQQEQERLRREASVREDAQRVARDNAVQQTLTSIKRLQPGGWLELIDAQNRRISCKLGLRIKSTGKLIFVDGLGRKVTELAPSKLADCIVDGSASILDYGVAFDDTLASLISDRSEKLDINEQG